MEGDKRDQSIGKSRVKGGDTAQDIGRTMSWRGEGAAEISSRSKDCMWRPRKSHVWQAPGSHEEKARVPATQIRSENKVLVA